MVKNSKNKCKKQTGETGTFFVLFLVQKHHDRSSRNSIRVGATYSASYYGGEKYKVLPLGLRHMLLVERYTNSFFVVPSSLENLFLGPIFSNVYQSQTAKVTCHILRSISPCRLLHFFCFTFPCFRETHRHGNVCCSCDNNKTCTN